MRGQYVLLDAVGEGLEGGDVLAGGDHLGDEEEADGRGQHVGSDAGEVVGVVLPARQLSGVALAAVRVHGQGDGHHQQAGLRDESGTVA